jgi:hypothetical protein
MTFKQSKTLGEYPKAKKKEYIWSHSVVVLYLGILGVGTTSCFLIVFTALLKCIDALLGCSPNCCRPAPELGMITLWFSGCSTLENPITTVGIVAARAWLVFKMLFL